MAQVSKTDVNLIFAENAPEQDKPPAFDNYTQGWGASRANNGKPTIKGFNFLQQRTDQSILWIHQNGGALPYDEKIDYVDGAIVLKDGVLKKKNGQDWKQLTYSDSDIITWTGANQQFENKSSLTSCYDLSGLRVLSVTENRTCFVVAQEVRGLWLYLSWLDKPDNGKSIVRSKFGGCWLFVGRMNNTNDLRTMGAVGDGVADDTDYVRQALNSGVRNFVGDATYLVTDVELVRQLKDTTGDGVLLYNGTKYPFGDIVNFGVGMAVPSVFFNIQYCFDWLKSKRIKNGEAFIKVDDGEYNQDFPNLVEHIDGKLIKIIGNESDPSKCKFNFDNGNNNTFFHMTKAYEIGFINGFHVKGTRPYDTTTGVWQDQVYGAMVRCINGGIINCGKAMISEDMYYGCQAKSGGTINAEHHPDGDNTYGGGFKVYRAGDVGFHAFGGTVRCNGAEVYDTWDSVSDLGFGYCSEANGVVECEFSISTGNHRAGYYTLTGGAMWAHGVQGFKNKFGGLCWGGHMEINSTPNKKTNLYENETGLYATQQGQVGANGVSCTKNTIYGFHAELNSTIDINGCTADDNGQAGFFADRKGSMSGGGLSAQRNGTHGFSADTFGALYVENFTVADNKAEQVKAKNLGSIIAVGLPDWATCSPPVNTLGNNGSYVFDNVVA